MPGCKPQPIDGIAAVVNDAIITKSEVANQVSMVRMQIQANGNSLPDEKALKKQVLEHLNIYSSTTAIGEKNG